MDIAYLRKRATYNFEGRMNIKEWRLVDHDVPGLIADGFDFDFLQAVIEALVVVE